MPHYTYELFPFVSLETVSKASNQPKCFQREWDYINFEQNKAKINNNFMLDAFLALFQRQILKS